MAEYTKQWLPLEQQVERLVTRGLTIDSLDRAISVLEAIGYYRLTGYLYPFLESERFTDSSGRSCTRVLGSYMPGTTLNQVEDVIEFDRRLRLLVLEAVERIEVAVRMRTGYILGRSSPFAHEDVTLFDESFTEQHTDSRDPQRSKHVQWLERVKVRRDNSDEQFVSHFRDKYSDRMPVWALTELLELGQLSTSIEECARRMQRSLRQRSEYRERDSWAAGLRV